MCTPYQQVPESTYISSTHQINNKTRYNLTHPPTSHSLARSKQLDRAPNPTHSKHSDPSSCITTIYSPPTVISTCSSRKAVNGQADASPAAKNVIICIKGTVFGTQFVIAEETLRRRGEKGASKGAADRARAYLRSSRYVCSCKSCRQKM